jgi:hypothetical protein
MQLSKYVNADPHFPHMHQESLILYLGTYGAYMQPHKIDNL